MNLQLGPWDAVLLIVVTAQSTMMAYLHAPRLKALIYVLPVPFTLASLALGQPLDSTHVLGICLVPLYANTVRWLHYGARLPISAAIALAATCQALLSVALARVVPVTAAAFWLSLGLLLAGGLAIYVLTPAAHEPGYRSPLPVPIKTLLVAAVISGLILAKSYLGGFMSAFPMVGIVGAYEARHSLRTLCRAVPVLMISFVPLLIAGRLLGPSMGLGWALLVGWGGYLLTMWVLSRLTPGRETQERAKSKQAG